MVSVLYSILLLWAIPCHAFVTTRQKGVLAFVHRDEASQCYHRSKKIAAPSQEGTATLPALRAGAVAGADYSGAARVLFGNMLGPAAMLTGGLVPLTFLASPLPHEGKPWKKKMQCLYSLLGVLSLSNELLAIMYATAASNKLTEVAAAPALSVFGLIKRDYELQWVATNVHFMLGLMGFVGMIIIRALTIFPASLNKTAAGFAGAALLAMCNVVNVGVSEGDRRGDALGGNILSLVARYFVLLSNNVRSKKGVVATASIVLALVSLIGAVQNLIEPET